MAPTTEAADIAGYNISHDPLLERDADCCFRSLMIDEIPVKLRCAACDKLAVDAFRMPCCDQSICEECELCKFIHKKLVIPAYAS